MQNPTVKIGSSESIFYHYTDQNGLIGILNTKNLWASHVLFQNDSKEFAYGKDLFCEYIDEVFSQEIPDSPDNLMEEIADWLTVFDSPIFTISFSEDDCSLNQFRAYSKARSGFSIGINIDKLRNNLRKTAFLSTFEKCLYRKDDQIQFIRKKLEECIIENRIDDKKHDELIPLIAAKIASCSPVLKHSSFSEEREWRLIFDYFNPVREHYKFRAGGSFVIPYLEVPLNPSETISSIVVGPTPHSDLAMIATKELASHFKLFGKSAKERIKYSNLPYRSW